MTDIIDQRIRQSQHIKAQLELAGYKLRDVDRQYKLPKCTTGRCLYEPNEAAEKAIAAVLCVAPHTLWRERYDQVTGKRFSPQPLANYDRLPSVRQRRKSDVHSTMGART